MRGASTSIRNRFVDHLPGDPEAGPRLRQVHGACYSRVDPTPVAAPQCLAVSESLRADLNWPGIADDPSVVAVLGGNRVHPAMKPYAACYGGHQFGHWAGQLGDGRAITLCEWIDGAGQHQDIQLKGAGPTPYSRRADGRAVLRSSVREFLCSEAMHALGVPTTRALSLVETGDPVVRDMLYDGHPEAEPGAIVCRVAPSFLRFGSFEIFRARSDVETLKLLLDYCITTCFPELGAPGADVYLGWLAEVSRRTAEMIIAWMRVGFVHGVMNTDNMSILGLTIDYGPYGWLDDFNPDWTPNTTDAERRRYRYGHQPAIAGWNLRRLAEAIAPLVPDPVGLEAAIEVYDRTISGGMQDMWADKLGLDAPRIGDEALVQDLLRCLVMVETDMTIFFRRLADLPPVTDRAGEKLWAHFLEAQYRPDAAPAATRGAWVDWLRRYLDRVAGMDHGRRRAAMNAVNPKFVLRNYLAQEAIEAAARGDRAPLQRLQRVLERPYDEQPHEADLAKKRPDWARHKPGCSMLSCSS